MIRPAAIHDRDAVQNEERGFLIIVVCWTVAWITEVKDSTRFWIYEINLKKRTRILMFVVC